MGKRIAWKIPKIVSIQDIKVACGIAQKLQKDTRMIYGIDFTIEPLKFFKHSKRACKDCGTPLVRGHNPVSIRCRKCQAKRANRIRWGKGGE